MNKRQIIASLNKVANELDVSGLYKEANTITNIMKRLAEDFDYGYDMGGDDPNIAREFDATENANKFMTKEYTLILKNYEHKEEMMRIPASKVVKGYMFDYKELIRSLRNAGFGPGGRTGGPDGSYIDGYDLEVDRENKTITLSVDTASGRHNPYYNSFKRIPTENPEFADKFHSDSIDLESRKRRERIQQQEMDAFYPQI